MDANARREALQSLVTTAGWPAIVRAQRVAGRLRVYLLWSNDAFVNVDDAENDLGNVFAVIREQLRAARFDPMTGEAMIDLSPRAAEA